MPKALSSVASSNIAPDSGSSTDAFIGYVYGGNYYAAVYNTTFVSGGYQWYAEIWYLYTYSNTYFGYGVNYWYYYFGWNYYGWVCCY